VRRFHIGSRARWERQLHADVDGARGLYAGKERVEGAKAANQYCDTLGKHMIIRRTDGNGVPGLGPVTSNMVFSCVASDDPEYQRPNLRHDPNVVIEDRR
jgi:hypothetical protein